jgi:hypothetical protein
LTRRAYWLEMHAATTMRSQLALTGIVIARFNVR